MFWIHIYLYINSRGPVFSESSFYCSCSYVRTVLMYPICTLTRLILGLDFSTSQEMVGPLDMSGICYVPYGS